MRIGRIGAALVVAGLTSVGTSVATSTPAAAADVALEVTCLQNPDLTGPTIVTGSVSVDAPAEVEMGATFTATLSISGFANPQAVPVYFGPFSENFGATGGASPATFSFDAPVQGPLNMGDVVDLGVHSQDITAPSAEGTIEITADSIVFDVSLEGTTPLSTITCTPNSATVLASIEVTGASVPGQPNAVGDSGEVKPGESVTIDVLANDEKGIDENQTVLDWVGPEVIADPAEGSATVNADGTVTYQANADTTATSDSFRYQICSVDTELCDDAAVTIGITQAQATTTTAPATTTTAAGNELPRTGSSSLPLGLLGSAAAILGLGLVAAGQRRGANA